MTTVVDPLGTPLVTFNRSGAAIVSVAGGSTAGATRQGSGDEANPIPRVCQYTIVLAFGEHVFSPERHLILFRLPSDAEVGDVVEVYVDPTSTDGAFVYPNVGERIANLPVSTGSNTDVNVSVPTVSGVIFRKVSSSLWMPIVGAG